MSTSVVSFPLLESFISFAPESYSRLCYVEFSLSEHKADIYRCVANSLKLFGGRPRKIIVDDLTTAASLDSTRSRSTVTADGWVSRAGKGGAVGELTSVS